MSSEYGHRYKINIPMNKKQGEFSEIVLRVKKMDGKWSSHSYAYWIKLCDSQYENIKFNNHRKKVYIPFSEAHKQLQLKIDSKIQIECASLQTYKFKLNLWNLVPMSI